MLVEHEKILNLQQSEVSIKYSVNLETQNRTETLLMTVQNILLYLSAKVYKMKLFYFI